MNIDNVSEQSIYIVLCSLAVEKGKENEEKEETNERRFFEIFENLKKKQSLRKKVFYIYIRTGQRGISSADCPFAERKDGREPGRRQSSRRDIASCFTERIERKETLCVFKKEPPSRAKMTSA